MAEPWRVVKFAAGIEHFEEQVEKKIGGNLASNCLRDIISIARSDKLKY